MSILKVFDGGDEFYLNYRQVTLLISLKNNTECWVPSTGQV